MATQMHLIYRIHANIEVSFISHSFKNIMNLSSWTKCPNFVMNKNLTLTDVLRINQFCKTYHYCETSQDIVPTCSVRQGRWPGSTPAALSPGRPSPQPEHVGRGEVQGQGACWGPEGGHISLGRTRTAPGLFGQPFYNNVLQKRYHFNTLYMQQLQTTEKLFILIVVIIIS